MPTVDIRNWSNDQLPVKEGNKVAGIIQRRALDQGDVALNAIYPKYSYTSLRNGSAVYYGTSFGAAVDAFQYQRLQDRGLA